jgi:hypothetical protein
MNMNVTETKYRKVADCPFLHYKYTKNMCKVDKSKIHYKKA